MDKLSDYNNSMEQIFHILKALDIAASKGLIKRTDRINCTYLIIKQEYIFSSTRESLEKLLETKIKFVTLINTYSKADFIREDSYLSKEEKDKKLAVKKKN